MNKMIEHEVIKALAYGKTVDEICEAEDVTREKVLEVEKECAKEIDERKEELKNGGY